MTESTLTTYETTVTTPRAAAARIGRYLREMYSTDDVMVLSKSRSHEMGYYADATITLEGAYEWPFSIDFYERCKIDRDKVFLEAYSGWALSLYRKVD
jgi:hypothetical protein